MTIVLSCTGFQQNRFLGLFIRDGIARHHLKRLNEFIRTRFPTEHRPLQRGTSAGGHVLTKIDYVTVVLPRVAQTQVKIVAQYLGIYLEVPRNCDNQHEDTKSGCLVTIQIRCPRA